MSKSGTGIFLKILKVFASIILSFIFIVTSFSIPILHSAASLFTPKTVTTVVQNIDFAEMIENSEEFNSAIADLGLEKEAVNEIMQSKEFGDFLESCTGTVMEVVIDDPENIHAYDPLVLHDIIEQHIDEIAEVLQENIDKPLNKEDIHSTMNKLVENNSEQIKDIVVDLAPDETIMTPYKSIMSIVKTASSWTFVLIAVLVEILILGLIYLLNKNKFGGFIWIAVNSLIVAILLTVVLVVLNSSLITGILSASEGLLLNVATTMLGTVTAKLLIAIIILAVVGVGAIAVFIPLKIKASKKAIEGVDSLPLKQETTATEQAPEETQE